MLSQHSVQNIESLCFRRHSRVCVLRSASGGEWNSSTHFSLHIQNELMTHFKTSIKHLKYFKKQNKKTKQINLHIFLYTLFVTSAYCNFPISFTKRLGADSYLLNHWPEKDLVSVISLIRRIGCDFFFPTSPQPKRSFLRTISPPYNLSKSLKKVSASCSASPEGPPD